MTGASIDHAFRRLSTLLGLVLVWIALFSAIDAAFLAIVTLVRNGNLFLLLSALDLAFMLAICAVVPGVAFAFMFGFTEYGRPIAELSLSRTALLGTIASAIVPLVVLKVNLFVVNCSIGALVSVTLIAIARRADARTRERRVRLRDLAALCVHRAVRSAIRPASAPS